jgi:long-chain acyl-CoA synthetase
VRDDLMPSSTNHCPLSIIFSTPSHITSLLKLVPKCPSLRVIVSIDTLPPAEKTVLQDWANHVGIELLELPELERWGASEGIRTDPGPVKGLQGELELDQERVASISYTSGTTGELCFYHALTDQRADTRKVIPRE